MSEDFDKEAERERLREKYERDKKKREATEQMSELLLQGATMTNAHCSECGDPIFRYDGQEFCPTCEKPVDRGTGEETTGDEEDGDDSEQIEVTTPSDDARVAFGEGEDEEGATDADTADEATPEDQEETQQPRRPETPSPSPDDTQTPESPRQPAPRESEPRAQAGERQPPRQPQGSTAATGVGAADVGAAREALVETLNRFSQKAAATEDPNQAREHLAAAREAAEALAALRQ